MDMNIYMILWLITKFVLSVFIAYKCCEKMNFAGTWILYLCFEILTTFITNGLSNILFVLLFLVVKVTIMVLIFYKIYEYSDYSFLKFFGLTILIIAGFLIPFSIVMTFLNH